MGLLCNVRIALPLPKSLQTSFLWREGSLNTGGTCLLCGFVSLYVSLMFCVSYGFVSLISTTGSGLLLLRSPTSPAAVYCIMGSYYVMSPPCCAGRHAVLIVKTIAFLAAS